VADRQTAYVLETSDRQWALRRVDDIASVSNHLSIGADWDALSDGAIEHAIAGGWWNEECDDRFDFAAAYRDTSVVPDTVSSARHLRTCTLLEHGKGSISVASLRTALRDHYGSAAPPHDLTPADARYFTVCMHAEPVGTTTASLIARVTADAREPLTYWASFGSPCVAAFIPLFVDCDIPAVLTRGGEQPSDDSLWWLSKRVLASVERDWQHRAPLVRQDLDTFESEITERMDTERVATRSAAVRAGFVQTTVDRLVIRLRRLLTELDP
jgi:secernin